MGNLGVMVLIGLVLILAAGVYGAVATRKSLAVGVIGLAVALLFAGGAWYAWVESRSAGWTLGYGTVALAAAVVSVYHLSGVRDQ